MSFGAGLLGALPSLIGLATEIGTSVPALKKAKRRDTTQRAVRQGQVKMSQAAVGGAQTGFGGSRGLALREGIRGASSVARASLDPISTAAAADEAAFIAERDARNLRLQKFGKDLGGMVAATTEQVVKNRKAGRAEDEAISADGAAGRVADWGAPTNTVEDIAANQQTLEQTAPVPGPMELQDPTAQFGAPQQAQAPGVEGPGQLRPPSMDELYNSSMGLGPNPLLQMAPELEFKLRVSNLAADEAKRQGVPLSVVGGRLNRAMDNAPSYLGDLYGDSPNYDGEDY